MIELDDIRKRTEGHTSGSWSWHSAKHDDGRNNGSVIYEPRPGMAYCVAKAPQFEDDTTWSANAALIAAAPDLLRIATEQETELTQLRTERDRLRDLRNAVWEWWRTKRPSVYTPQMHHDNPHVNAIDDAERLMIDQLLDALTQREGGEDDHR